MAGVGRHGVRAEWEAIPVSVRTAIDAWSRRHVAVLADIAGEVDAAVTGSVLVHGDYRTDNVVFHATDERLGAAVAGYFTQRSNGPPPPGLPTVRQFQAAQGAIARRWIAQRLGLA